MSPNQILSILWRRSWIVALTFLSALGVAVAILLVVPGRYDATATASIESGRSNPLAVNSMSSAELGLAQGNIVSLVSSKRVALAVVKQLALANDRATQDEFRKSEAFGRIPIEEWIALGLMDSVKPDFILGSNVLTIKGRSNSALRSALIANAFLSATIDATIEMKAASSQQVARWFQPQMESLRADVVSARAALEKYQKETSTIVPSTPLDTGGSQLMSVTQELSTTSAQLAALQSRLESQSLDIAIDPADPDLQTIAALKSKISSTEADTDLMKMVLGVNNAKVVSGLASIRALQSQLDDATKKSREHLRQRIETVKVQVRALEEAKSKALHDRIDEQVFRDRLTELQRNLALKQERLDSEERAAAQAELQSKLTFSDIVVLDKATPPSSPAFPKPFVVLAVSIVAGLSLGLILALLAEALDRRVRFVEDLALATSAPVLGAVSYRRVSLPTRRNIRLKRVGAA